MIYTHSVLILLPTALSNSIFVDAIRVVEVFILYPCARVLTCRFLHIVFSLTSDCFVLFVCAQSRFGNIGGKIPTLRAFSSASNGGSGVATPVSGKTAGLSLGSVTGTSTAGACLLHGQPFSRFCQSHMRVVCEQCIEELERPNATLGKTCAVQVWRLLGLEGLRD